MEKCTNSYQAIFFTAPVARGDRNKNRATMKASRRNEAVDILLLLLLSRAVCCCWDDIEGGVEEAVAWLQLDGSDKVFS